MSAGRPERAVELAVDAVALLGSSERFWCAEELAEVPGVDDALVSLCAGGELVEIRPGVYWRGRLESVGSASFRSVPDPQWVLSYVFDDLTAVGPSGPGAANALGVSTQVAANMVLAVPFTPPEPFYGFRFVDRSERTARLAAGLLAVEVAVLEALEVWHLYADYPDAAFRLGSQVIEHCDVSRLVSGASTETSSTLARLVVVLGSQGVGVEFAGDPADLVEARRALGVRRV